MMMKVEARLKVRIRKVLDADLEDNQVCGPTIFEKRLRGYTPYSDMVVWRKFDDTEVDELARWVLHRLMANRMRDGKQFDSIIAASAKALGHRMINKMVAEASDTPTNAE